MNPLDPQQTERPTSADHDVWVVDPSLFTLPYDHELCQALAAIGLRVRLIGRPLRAEEATVSPPRYEFEPMFYRRSEAGRRALMDLGVDDATIEILPHPPLPIPVTGATAGPDRADTAKKTRLMYERTRRLWAQGADRRS